MRERNGAPSLAESRFPAPCEGIIGIGILPPAPSPGVPSLHPQHATDNTKPYHHNGCHDRLHSGASSARRLSDARANRSSLKSTPGGKMMMRGRRTRPSRSRRDDARAAFATSRSTPTISATCPLARPTIADRRGRTLARAHLRLSPLAGSPSRPIAFRSLTPRVIPRLPRPSGYVTSKVSTGIKAQGKKAVRASKATGAVAFLDNKKRCASPPSPRPEADDARPAKADLTSDLIAKSEANKELNDKKRAATSSGQLPCAPAP